MFVASVTDASGKTECPTCQEPNLLSDARLNKHLQREIYDLKVRCKHHEAGCQWVGELRDLKDHLDPDKRRRAMKHHKLHVCPKRGQTCKYCNYQDTIMEQHLPVCREFPVKCPNKCKIKGLKRKQLKAHINECPLQRIECPFSSAGCTVKLPRNQMETHEDIRRVFKGGGLGCSSTPCVIVMIFIIVLCWCSFK